MDDWSLSTVQELKVVDHVQYLGALSASLILHSDDNVWRFGVLLLSLCGAVVGISALSGGTALVTALGPRKKQGQYKVDGNKRGESSYFWPSAALAL